MERNKIAVEELPHANRLVYNMMVEKMGSENKSGFARLLSEGYDKQVSEQRISRLFFLDKRSGKYPKVSEDIQERIIERFGLSEDYFVKRKDKGSVTLPHREEMIVSDSTDASLLQAFSGLGGMEKLARSGFVCVPLVPSYAHAGYLAGFGDPEYLDTLPTVPFLPDRRMTGNYVAFEVKGDSMDDGTADSYKDGEVLICREVEPDYYKNDRLHINKRDFVIVHKDGILVKRIVAHDVERHTITIHSLNPMYNDEDINLADVRQVFSVVSSQRSRQR